MMNNENMYQDLLGKYVQMDDRFESVHIWSKQLAEINNGKWKPIEISKEIFDKEKMHNWNK